MEQTQIDALYDAIKNNNISIVKKYIQPENPEFNSIPAWISLPLSNQRGVPSILMNNPPLISIATYFQSTTIAEYLLKNGAEISDTDDFDSDNSEASFKRQNTDFIKFLQNFKDKVNEIRSLIYCCDAYDNIPLLVAPKGEKLTRILTVGSQFHVNSSTPLSIAAEKNNSSLIYYLSSKVPNFTPTSNDLLIAIKNSSNEAIHALIKCGVILDFSLLFSEPNFGLDLKKLLPVFDAYGSYGIKDRNDHTFAYYICQHSWKNEMIIAFLKQIFSHFFFNTIISNKDQQHNIFSSSIITQKIQNELSKYFKSSCTAESVLYSIISNRNIPLLREVFYDGFPLFVENHYSLLHFAAEKRDFEIIQVLFELDPNLSPVKVFQNKTPLDLSLQVQELDSLSYLLNNISIPKWMGTFLPSSNNDILFEMKQLLTVKTFGNYFKSALLILQHILENDPNTFIKELMTSLKNCVHNNNFSGTFFCLMQGALVLDETFDPETILFSQPSPSIDNGLNTKSNQKNEKLKFDKNQKLTNIYSADIKIRYETIKKLYKDANIPFMKELLQFFNKKLQIDYDYDEKNSLALLFESSNLLLHIASAYSPAIIVKFFIDSKFDVDEVDEMGLTPAQNAFYHARFGSLLLLLDSYALFPSKELRPSLFIHELANMTDTLLVPIDNAQFNFIQLERFIDFLVKNERGTIDNLDFENIFKDSFNIAMKNHNFRIAEILLKLHPKLDKNNQFVKTVIASTISNDCELDISDSDLKKRNVHNQLFTEKTFISRNKSITTKQAIELLNLYYNELSTNTVESKNEGLLEATKINNRNLIRYFLLNGSNLDFMHNQNCDVTYLHNLLKNGNISLLSSFYNININVIDSKGRTPFYCACKCKKFVNTFSYDYKNLDIGKMQYVFGEDQLQQLIDLGASIMMPTNSGNFPLHATIKSGNFKALKFLLDKGTSPYLTNNKRQSILHTAVKYCRIKMIEYLIYLAKDLIYWRDINGKTPCHKAFSHKISDSARNQMLKKMIIQKESGELLDHNGNSPFSLSILADDKDLINYFSKLGSRLFPFQGSILFPILISQGKIELAEKCINFGGSIEAPFKGESFVVKAICQSNSSWIDFVNNHISIALNNRKYLHSLMDAMHNQKKNLSEIQNLKKKEADRIPETIRSSFPGINSFQQLMNNLLCKITNEDAIKVFEECLQYGYDPNEENGVIFKLLNELQNSLKDSKKQIKRGEILDPNPELAYCKPIEIALMYGADPNQCLKKHYNPLNITIRSKFPDIEKLLIIYGADLKNSINNYISKKSDQKELLRSLIEAGANIFTKTAVQQTYLHLSTQYKLFETCSLLIKSGAFLDIPDENNI